jgi:hypothetical protein
MKAKLTILFVAYVVLGLGGFLDLGRMNYIDQDGFNDYIRSYIPLRITASALLTWLSWNLYKKYAPEKYEKQKDKWSFRFLSPLIFLVLFFVLNTGILLPLNHLSSQQDSIHLAGIVMNKDSRFRSKGGRNYFLSITDTVVSKNYFFQVHKKIYNRFRQDDVFVKDFKKGSLGIIYREEE